MGRQSTQQNRQQQQAPGGDKPPPPASENGPVIDGQIGAVQHPKVNAGPCPKSKSHPNTRVYRTKGQTRFCVCDDCGETWKKSGPLADADMQYLLDLADTLDNATTVKAGDSEVVCMESKTRNAVTAKLRKIASK